MNNDAPNEPGDDDIFDVIAEDDAIRPVVTPSLRRGERSERKRQKRHPQQQNNNPLALAARLPSTALENHHRPWKTSARCSDHESRPGMGICNNNRLGNAWWRGALLQLLAEEMKRTVLNIATYRPFRNMRALALEYDASQLDVLFGIGGFNLYEKKKYEFRLKDIFFPPFFELKLLLRTSSPFSPPNEPKHLELQEIMEQLRSNRARRRLTQRIHKPTH
jgi:hypothetical protein